MRMSPTKFRIAQNFPGREQLSPLQPMVMGSSSPETGQLPLKYVWKRITVWFPSRYVISVLYKYIQCIHHSFFVCTFTRLPPTQKKEKRVRLHDCCSPPLDTSLPLEQCLKPSVVPRITGWWIELPIYQPTGGLDNYMMIGYPMKYTPQKSYMKSLVLLVNQWLSPHPYCWLWNPQWIPSFWWLLIPIVVGSSMVITVMTTPESLTTPSPALTPLWACHLARWTMIFTLCLVLHDGLPMDTAWGYNGWYKQ